MSEFSGEFDKKQLLDEMQSAIETDKRYWLRNEAKIKAATTSKTYEEFREYVAAAHLTPLSKSDKEKKHNNWNTIARNSK